LSEVVIDASYAAAWIFKDEATEETNATLAGLTKIAARVPAIYWYEVRNLLITGSRRSRISNGDIFPTMAYMRGLPLTDCGPGDDRKILTLALTHNLTAYDAAYLELALSRNAQLATCDRRLREAAELEGVSAYKSNS
jgi:predicted nucleic acid-binding protein